MKDRVPTYPGRVTLTPVSGQTNTYDMARADAPVEAGMPLNKSTLMPDALATALGLDPETATPADGIEAAASAKYVVGTYTATSGAVVTVTLGFRPIAVQVFGKVGDNKRPKMSLSALTDSDNGVVRINSTGFTVQTANFDATENPYRYIAFKG